MIDIKEAIKYYADEIIDGIIWTRRRFNPTDAVTKHE